MEKERKIRTLNLVALIVAVLGLTIAFAALSKTLTINGTASVDAASWDIHIENLEDAVIEGTAEEKSKPSISQDGATLDGINVSFAKPGDSISYTFEIVNNGTINAKFDKFLVNNYDYFSLDDTTAVNAFKSIFPSFDWDGDGVSSDEEYEQHMGDITPFDQEKLFKEFGDYVDESSQSVVLKPGDRAKVTLYMDYNDSAQELPKGDVIMNVNLKFNFVQAN